MSRMTSTSPRFLVRRALPADLDALVALEQRAFDGDRISRAQYRRHLTSRSVVILVAVDPTQAVIGAAVLFFRAGSRVARLYSLATAPEARGMGVATALLEAVIAAASDRACHALRLEVRQTNLDAIRLYQRHGFRPTIRLSAYYEDGADAWRYERPLPPR